MSHFSDFKPTEILSPHVDTPSHVLSSPVPVAQASVKPHRRFRPYRRALFVLLLPLSFLLTALAAANPHITESVYSRGIYPFLAGTLGRFFGLFPFAVAEFLLYVLILTAVVWLCVQIVSLVTKKEKGNRALGMLATICCVSGIGYFLFTAFCGLNYHRITFAEQSGLAVRPSSVQELGSLYQELVDRTNYLRALVPENEYGVMVFYPESFNDLARRAPQGIERLAERYPVLGGFTPPPKPVLASRGLSIMRVSGIYIPFTFEATVNAEMPHFNIPFTMMHELAHFKGFMREDEANFIAYLASREMDDPVFQYSGTVLALIYTGNALFSVAPELQREIISGLHPAVLRDFADNRAFWQQFEGPVAQAVTAVNDAYLRHNRQEDGVLSYGRMVDLLLADYRERHRLQ